MWRLFTGFPSFFDSVTGQDWWLHIPEPLKMTWFLFVSHLKITPTANMDTQTTLKNWQSHQVWGNLPFVDKGGLRVQASHMAVFSFGLPVEINARRAPTPRRSSSLLACFRTTFGQFHCGKCEFIATSSDTKGFFPSGQSGRMGGDPFSTMVRSTGLSERGGNFSPQSGHCTERPLSPDCAPRHEAPGSAALQGRPLEGLEGQGPRKGQPCTSLWKNTPPG